MNRLFFVRQSCRRLWSSSTATASNAKIKLINKFGSIGEYNHRQMCRRLWSSLTDANDNINLMTGCEYNQRLYKPETQQKASFLRYLHFSSVQHQKEKLILEVGNEDDFDEIVYHSIKPILVQFYADWCGPCQNLAPRLEAKVVGQQGKIILVKVNVESGTAIAERFEVQAVPTVLCFKYGEKVHSFQGDVDDAYLDQIMANLMLKDESLYKSSSGRIVEEDEEKDKIF